jgi:hypothetical protein
MVINGRKSASFVDFLFHGAHTRRWSGTAIHSIGQLVNHNQSMEKCNISSNQINQCTAIIIYHCFSITPKPFQLPCLFRLFFFCFFLHFFCIFFCFFCFVFRFSFFRFCFVLLLLIVLF